MTPLLDMFETITPSVYQFVATLRIPGATIVSCEDCVAGLSVAIVTVSLPRTYVMTTIEVSVSARRLTPSHDNVFHTIHTLSILPI